MHDCFRTIETEVQRIGDDFDQWWGILESSNIYNQGREFGVLTESLKSQYKQIYKALKECNKAIKLGSENADLYPDITQVEWDLRSLFVAAMQLAIDNIKNSMQSNYARSKIVSDREAYERNAKEKCKVDEKQNDAKENSSSKDENTEEKEKEKEIDDLDGGKTNIRGILARNRLKSQCMTNPFVILIGIEDYTKAQEYQSLDGVKQDIYRMIHLWCDIYGYKNISMVFISSNNNKKAVIKKLDQYKAFLNFPLKNISSMDILSDRQSFGDYLARIRSFIDYKDENDGIIFYYSGHGVKDKIILSNGKPFAIQEIINTFDGKHCVSLRNKPKIMIYDCCRGSGIGQTYSEKEQEKEKEKAKPKTRGNQNNNWYDNMHHVNSGLATIFSNFAGYSINDSEYGGCLTRAIEETFKDPKLIEKSSLHDLIFGIRQLTKIYSGRGNVEFGCSSQLVDFHETLEYNVHFQPNVDK